jgi:hypothetical protein
MTPCEQSSTTLTNFVYLMYIEIFNLKIKRTHSYSGKKKMRGTRKHCLYKTLLEWFKTLKFTKTMKTCIIPVNQGNTIVL